MQSQAGAMGEHEGLEHSLGEKRLQYSIERFRQRSAMDNMERSIHNDIEVRGFCSARLRESLLLSSSDHFLVCLFGCLFKS